MSREAVEAVFVANGGVATTQDLRTVLSRKGLEVAVRAGRFVRVRRGVYAMRPPGVPARLAALDLALGTHNVACMHTAADMYGFDTEPDDRLHVLDPGIRMRPAADVMVQPELSSRSPTCTAKCGESTSPGRSTSSSLNTTVLSGMPTRRVGSMTA